MALAALGGPAPAQDIGALVRSGISSVGSSGTSDDGARLPEQRVLRDEIDGFFQAYGQAFDAMDANRIASLHHAPCLKIHGDGSIQCLPTPEAVRGFFQALMERYRERENHSAIFLDLEVVAIGAHAALAAVTWEQKRTDGRVYRRFRRSYNLVRAGPGWKIVAATAHRE